MRLLFLHCLYSAEEFLLDRLSMVVNSGKVIIYGTWRFSVVVKVNLTRMLSNEGWDRVEFIWATGWKEEASRWQTGGGTGNGLYPFFSSPLEPDRYVTQANSILWLLAFISLSSVAAYDNNSANATRQDKTLSIFNVVRGWTCWPG